MKTNEKTIRYGENFNPFLHLSNSEREDGLPAMEPLIIGGVPQFIIDAEGQARQALVPRFNIDGNAMRDWLYTAYPNARVEVIRGTADPVYDQDAKRFIFPPEVVEVRIFKEQEAEHYAANGFGKVPVVEGAKYPELPSAITVALKNAMANMGFAVDINWESLKENAPKFTTIGVGETVSSVIPAYDLESEKSLISAEPEKVTPEEPKAVAKEEKDPIFENPAFKAMGKSEERVEEQETRVNEPLVETEEAADPDEEAYEKALNVVFRSAAPQFAEVTGKTFREIEEETPGFCQMIAKKPARWKDVLSDEVIEAAKVIELLR